MKNELNDPFKMLLNIFSDNSIANLRNSIHVFKFFAYKISISGRETFDLFQFNFYIKIS